VAKAQRVCWLDESIKDLAFPKLDITPDKNGKAVEIPTYYWSGKTLILHGKI
jgi:hypothetical protein